MVLIKSSNLRNHARWPELTEIFLKKANTNFMLDILIDPMAQTLPGWSKSVDRFITTSNESITVTEFLSNLEIYNSKNWDKWVSMAMKNQNFDEGDRLLSEGFVLRHSKWNDLSLEYITMNGDDQAKASFLSNEYVQKKPMWKHLVKTFLENSQDQGLRQTFLQLPEVQALNLTLTGN